MGPIPSSDNLKQCWDFKLRRSLETTEEVICQSNYGDEWMDGWVHSFPSCFDFLCHGSGRCAKSHVPGAGLNWDPQLPVDTSCHLTGVWGISYRVTSCSFL